MKLFIAVFSALTVQSVNALQCWTCEEKSHADCLTYGSLVTCPLAGEPTNEDLIKSVVCGVMEHQRLGNRVNHVIAGCRQFEACYNDWSQNFISPNAQATFQQAVDYRLSQCDAENKRKISKCRQCCNTDNCNQAWITAGAAGSTAMSNTNWAVEPTDPIPDPMPVTPAA